MGGAMRDNVRTLVGVDRLEWAMVELLNIPSVVRPGWPAKRRRGVR